MIRARCLHRSGGHFTSITTNLASHARPLRKVSRLVISAFIRTPTNSLTQSYSAVAGASLRHEFARKQPLRTSGSWKSRQWPLQQLNGTFAPRFASTTPIPPPIAEDQAADVPSPQPSTSAEGEALLPPLDEMTSSIPPPVYDHLGFLKEMGLDYGWGPTALVETMLEHVHVYLGTPWWASLGITVFLFRAALFRFSLRAADNSARLRLIQDLEEPIKERLTAARAEQDIVALRELQSELAILRRSAGVNVWAGFMPLLQIPIGFGTFRLIRGMATLPVPGFDTGGFLWVPDLTISDPYFILPIITACAYHLAFKVPSLMIEY